MLLEESTYRLKIPDTVHQKAWNASESITLPGLRLQSYCNQVCLDTLLPWLQDKFEGTTVSVENPAFNPRQSEWVSGFSVELQRTGQPPLRLVCLPDETMDRSEMRIPQEWVDVPRWVGDYYLAIEVDPDEQEIEIWGYANHAQLKQQGEFDGCDRTYSLSFPDFFTDLSPLWVMVQVGTEPTRSAVPAVGELSPERKDTLLQQLSENPPGLARLQIPVAEWNALLEQPETFEQLLQHHQASLPAALATQTSPVTRLGQWLNGLYETGWQALEDCFGPNLQPALGLRDSTAVTEYRRVKALDFGREHPALWLFVLLDLEADGRFGIRIRLLPLSIHDRLPAEVNLSLQSEDGEVIQSVQSRPQDSSIQLKRFRCPPNTPFTVNITLADTTHSEPFTT
jgi:hypothetical protein